MRRAFITAVAAVGILGSSACDGFLTVTPRNVISRETYFKTEQHMEEAVVRLYATTSTMLGGNYRLVQDMRGDYTTLMLNINVPGFTFQIDEFSEATNDGTIGGLYNQVFTTIFDSNVIIGRLDEIPFENAARREELRAQALFSRALAYWLGIQLWGLNEGWQPNNLGIPFVTREIDNPDEAFTFIRATVKEEWDLIVKDLQTAKQHLPLRTSLTDTQARRFNRGAATFLLGATYQLDPSPATQQLALAQFEELANMGHSLITVGNQESDGNAYRQVFNPNIRFSNPEALLQFSGGTPSNANIAPLNSGGTTNAARVTNAANTNGDGSFMPTQFGILSFAGADPSEPATPFDLRYEGGYGVFCPGSGTNGRLGGVTDLLRTAGDITLRSPNPSYPEVNIPSVRDPVNKQVRTNCEAFYAKWRWPGFSGPDRIIFRYSDALLRRAEALVRLGRPNDALPFINQVRARAGLPALTTVTLDAILQERGWELDGESHRWTDLKRFGKAVEIISGPHAADRRVRIGRTPPAAYMASPSDRYRVRFPIRPDDVRLSQCGILQNPGWGASCTGA